MINKKEFNRAAQKVGKRRRGNEDRNVDGIKYKKSAEIIFI